MSGPALAELSSRRPVPQESFWPGGKCLGSQDSWSLAAAGPSPPHPPSSSRNAGIVDAWHRARHLIGGVGGGGGSPQQGASGQLPAARTGWVLQPPARSAVLGSHPRHPSGLRWTRRWLSRRPHTLLSCSGVAGVQRLCCGCSAHSCSSSRDSASTRSKASPRCY